MNTRLNPYITFVDTARPAMEFYHSVLGGKLVMNTFREAKLADNDNIMHAMLETDGGLVLMASDTPPGMTPPSGANMSVSLSGDNVPELTGYWNKLAEGAREIEAPFEKAPWGDTFGMLTDKFGIRWMVNAATPKQ